MMAASRIRITCAFFWKMPRSTTSMTAMTATKRAHNQVTDIGWKSYHLTDDLDLHGWSVLRQPRPRRLGGHRGHARGARRGAGRTRGADDEQPHGARRRHR